MTELSHAIAAQGDAIEAMLAADLSTAVQRLAPARRIWLIGTGTSQHAAELGAWMFARGPRAVRWSSSASFAWDEQLELGADDAVVVISHTAQTAFSARARARAATAGARLVSITAQGAGWPEAIETTPRERSETYTASYLAALVVLARLSLELSQSTLDPDRLGGVAQAVRCAALEPVLAGLQDRRLLVIAGVGPGAITAREGALKLREAARMAAEGYEAEYLLHGSAVPLGPDDALLALAPGHDRFDLLNRLAGAAAREGLTVATIDAPADLDPVLAQLPLTVALQVLAAQIAEARGADPDTVITGAWADDGLWRVGSP
ncbi:MAG: SIS domain-containing protein [Solirubrobacteraceae bacterium]